MHFECNSAEIHTEYKIKQELGSQLFYIVSFCDGFLVLDFIMEHYDTFFRDKHIQYIIDVGNEKDTLTAVMMEWDEVMLVDCH